MNASEMNTGSISGLWLDCSPGTASESVACVCVSRCRAALLLHGLHGTLQRHLKREQLAGRLPQHKACHKLPQHG